ncbi:MAG: hypothetical protein II921_05390 [Treponema sp.]|nr:hypothetical protein [Treponema sp.]
MPSNQEHFPITLRLFRRAVIFMFFLLIAYAILFFTGNYQNFLPENVNLILTLTTLVATVLFFSSIISIVLLIFYSIRAKKPLVLTQLIFFVFTTVFSSAFAVFTRWISILTEGF